MKEEEFSIEDLAQRSGLSIRTVRYYMQQGLVPGPDTAGKYASYSGRHLEHLAMVQRLKRLHLPLKEIRHLIANMTPDDMRQMLAMQDKLVINNMHLNMIDKEDKKSIKEELSSAKDYIEGLAQRQERVKRISESPPSYTPPQMQVPEHWSKIRLAEGIELNVREKEARALRREIHLLIEAAKRIFGKSK